MFWTKFTRAGILGMNSRNADYIIRQNPRRFYPLVDDKVLTKQVAIKAGIPVPELYGVVEFQNQAKKLRQMIAGRERFVIKPAQGSGGGGIVVIQEVVPEGYRKASGIIIDESALRYHVYNILSGLYALGGKTDKAIIEYCIDSHPIFAGVSYMGVPDIRVLVYKGQPVLAMLRLPTRESDGKANLHMGGIGVGIDMATGITREGLQHSRYITHHPDTGNCLVGIQIPDWHNILKIAARFYEITGLGYVGVDIVIDQQYGPMLLEVNARPGIAIQIANKVGLRQKLQEVDAAALAAAR